MPLKREFVDVKMNPPDAAGGAAPQAKEVVFPLAGTPDKAWNGFFSHIWEGEGNSYPGRCAVRVIRDRMVVVAAPEDVQKVHLDRLRRAVDAANATYRGFLSRELAILDSVPAENNSVDTRATIG